MVELVVLFPVTLVQIISLICLIIFIAITIWEARINKRKIKAVKDLEAMNGKLKDILDKEGLNEG